MNTHLSRLTIGVSALPAVEEPVLSFDSKSETLNYTAADIAGRLSSLGLEVRQGYFQMWGADECLPTYELMGSCFFNNQGRKMGEFL